MRDSRKSGKEGTCDQLWVGVSVCYAVGFEERGSVWLCVSVGLQPTVRVVVIACTCVAV